MPFCSTTLSILWTEIGSIVAYELLREARRYLINGLEKALTVAVALVLLIGPMRMASGHVEYETTMTR